jgi:anti-sigma regulatory factor (Ser/Thr protein kinase)
MSVESTHSTQDFDDSARRHIDLARDTSSPRRARGFVHDALADWHREDLVDEVTLAVSELVANAIVHAQSDVALTLLDLESGVQVRVRDNRPDPPREEHAGTYETHGRGLQIVATLSDRWGVEPSPPGKIVWLDISRPAPRVAFSTEESAEPTMLDHRHFTDGPFHAG